MCKSLTNYFPRNNDFLVTCFGKTQKYIVATNSRGGGFGYIVHICAVYTQKCCKFTCDIFSSSGSGTVKNAYLFHKTSI